MIFKHFWHLISGISGRFRESEDGIIGNFTFKFPPGVGQYYHLPTYSSVVATNSPSSRYIRWHLLLLLLLLHLLLLLLLLHILLHLLLHLLVLHLLLLLLLLLLLPHLPPRVRAIWRVVQVRRGALLDTSFLRWPTARHC